MKKTLEQLNYLINMYQEMISQLTDRTQTLYTKAEDDHNWFEEEDYPPHVPCLQEIDELILVLENKQKPYLEEIIEFLLNEGIGGKENYLYYEQLFKVRYKDAHVITEELINKVLASNLDEKDKENHINNINNIASVFLS